MRKTFLSILPILLPSCLAQQPIIRENGVLDAASYTPGVALGSLFVVRGANLGAAGAHYARLPLPTQLAGASIHFARVTGGVESDALLLSAHNQDGAGQLTALLPATLDPGDYYVTVTVEGLTSLPVTSPVLTRKFGLMSVAGTGAGRALVQNYLGPGRMDLNRFTTGTYAESNAASTHSPAKPGQVLVAWGTGLAAAEAENRASDVTVIVGVKEIAPFYAGRSPEFSGVDMINFELPQNVETGCTVPLQVRTGGRLSNLATIAIAPLESDACIHPEFSTEVLTRLDGGGTVVTAWFVLNSVGNVWDGFGFPLLIFDEWLAGGFSRFDADQVDHVFSPTTTEGTCRVYPYSGTWDSLLRGSGATALDAGTFLTLDSGFEDWQANRLPGNVYSGLGYLDLYPSRTLAGTGGRDIGPFRADIDPGASIKFRVFPAAIDRNLSATIVWSGGGTSLVSLIGLNESGGVFVCTTGADRGSLTVPPSVLTQAFPNSGQGKLLVLTTSQPATGNGRFTAPLIPGGTVDSAVFLSAVALNPVTYR